MKSPKLCVLMLAAFLSTMIASGRARQESAIQNSSKIYQNVYNGWKWWHVYCYRCHGMNAVGGTLAPNLIDPNARLPLKDFLNRVRNGSADGTMQAWDKLLDDKQITQLYYYVRARADKILPPGRPDEIGPKGSAWIPPKGWPKF
jgi:mono/diheme cytochrome c family protein